MTHTETAVKMILDRWHASVDNGNKLLNALTDTQLQNEITPGKNRGIYLLGHLIAVHDDMLILLNMGEKLYPAYYEPFIKNADKVITSLPRTSELRAAWIHQCTVMKQQFDELNTENWFEKHTAVSEEDFIKEPHRNKLNIIITRTSHLQYHLGQLMLLKYPSILYA